MTKARTKPGSEKAPASAGRSPEIRGRNQAAFDSDARIDWLNPSALKPHPHNKRAIDATSPAFRELVASIREAGIVQPLLIGSIMGEGREFYVIAGHRRLAAAQALGSLSVPCLVMDYPSIDAMLPALWIDNVQREDLAPLEQAAQIGSLLKAGHTVEHVAFMTGRARSWVARRAKLTNLRPALAAMAGGMTEHPDRVARSTGIGRPDLARWPIACLERLAALPGEVQDRVLAEMRKHPFLWATSCHGEPMTTERLEDNLAQELHLLKHAPWGMDEPVGAVGSLNPHPICASCPKRTGHEPDLFGRDTGAMGGEGDTCLDGACWTRKFRAAIDAKKDKLRQAHPDLELVEGEGHPGQPPAGVIPHHAYETTTKSAKGAKPAMVECGQRAGELIYIRPRAGQRISRNEGRPRKTVREKKAIVDRERRSWVVRERLTPAVLAFVLGEAKRGRATLSEEELLGLVHAFVLPWARIEAWTTHLSRTDSNAIAPWMILRGHGKTAREQQIAAFRRGVADVLEARLEGLGDDPDWGEVKRTAEHFLDKGEDQLQAWLAEAAGVIGYPKTWAAEAEKLPPSKPPEVAEQTLVKDYKATLTRGRDD